jgi:hypothetical protein
VVDACALVGRSRSTRRSTPTGGRSGRKADAARGLKEEEDEAQQRGATPHADWRKRRGGATPDAEAERRGHGHKRMGRGERIRKGERGAARAVETLPSVERIRLTANGCESRVLIWSLPH